MSLIIHELGRGYKENWDLTKLAQIQINLKPNLACNISDLVQENIVFNSLYKDLFSVNYQHWLSK